MHGRIREALLTLDVYSHHLPHPLIPCSTSISVSFIPSALPELTAFSYCWNATAFSSPISPWVSSGRKHGRMSAHMSHLSLISHWLAGEPEGPTGFTSPLDHASCGTFLSLPIWQTWLKLSKRWQLESGRMADWHIQRQQSLDLHCHLRKQDA